MTTETELMNYPQCKADSLVYDVIEHRPDISWDMSFGCQKDGFDESIFNFVIGFFFKVDVFDLLKLDIINYNFIQGKQKIPFILKKNVALILGLIKMYLCFRTF